MGNTKPALFRSDRDMFSFFYSDKDPGDDGFGGLRKGIMVFNSEVGANLKTPERIEALLFLYFVATTIHALLERHVRNCMKARDILSIPLYPEERACRAPTADKILGLFADLRVHRLTDDQRPVKTFWDELTPVQRTVLEMLEIPTSAFGP